jgi:hypothetical protein
MVLLTNRQGTKPAKSRRPGRLKAGAPNVGDLGGLRKAKA